VHQAIDIEALCAERGLRITEQRRVIAKVLSEATDHPDVEALHERASAIDPKHLDRHGLSHGAPVRRGRDPRPPRFRRWPRPL
jgi:hypothetical protein